MAGNSWRLAFQLTDANGSPLDLSAATLQWVLIDPSGNTVPNINATISVNQPASAGQGSIMISNMATAQLGPGRYADSLRATIEGMRSTCWTGNILVDANPFG
jgi:hypothetical protein